MYLPADQAEINRRVALFRKQYGPNSYLKLDGFGFVRLAVLPTVDGYFDPTTRAPIWPQVARFLQGHRDIFGVGQVEYLESHEVGRELFVYTKVQTTDGARLDWRFNYNLGAIVVTRGLSQYTWPGIDTRPALLDPADFGSATGDARKTLVADDLFDRYSNRDVVVFQRHVWPNTLIPARPALSAADVSHRLVGTNFTYYEQHMIRIVATPVGPRYPEDCAGPPTKAQSGELTEFDWCHVHYTRRTRKIESGDLTFMFLQPYLAANERSPSYSMRLAYRILIGGIRETLIDAMTGEVLFGEPGHAMVEGDRQLQAGSLNPVGAFGATRDRLVPVTPTIPIFATPLSTPID